MNFFRLETADYIRNIDIETTYYRDAATAIQKVSGLPFEACMAHVKKVTSEGGRLTFKDPRLKYVGRNQYGDRVLRETTFLNYIRTIVKHKLIVSPAMTIYKNPHNEKSMTAIYIEENVKRRKKSKTEKFLAQEDNNMTLAAFKDNEQQSQKIKNNALSGAHCSDSTPLFLDTIHSTLTSMCRSAAGYGNANNEKVISGNRHYWSSDIVLANIVRIINATDLNEFQAMMDQYGLVHPTVEDTMACIEYSTEFYWRSKPKMKIIRLLVEKLSPIERSVFVYTGDLHHIAKHNAGMMRNFLDKLSQRSETIEVKDPKALIKSLSGEVASHVSLLCGKYMDGKTLGKFHEFSEEGQRIVAGTTQHILNVLEEYRFFIKMILVSNTAPASLAQLPNIIRRCAVTSDTDSTIFTVQEWLEWYTGEISFKDKAVCIGHAVTLLASASITHILAGMSKHLGVVNEQLHQYAMKSEFYFPAFALTTRAKTYFAYVGAQEGQVFTKPKYEIKGAVLKGSNKPKVIMDFCQKFIEETLGTVMRDEKLTLRETLASVAKLEEDIMKSIAKGDDMYFSSATVKTAESYKQGPERSPYFHFMLWEEVFAEHYGRVEGAPYDCIKVSIDVNSQTEMNAWLDRMENPAIRTKLVEFMAKYGKTTIGMIYLPKSVIEVVGIPQEILCGIAIRRLISELLEPVYVLLEAIGFFMMDKKKRLRLVSDHYRSDMVV